MRLTPSVRASPASSTATFPPTVRRTRASPAESAALTGSHGATGCRSGAPAVYLPIPAGHLPRQSTSFRPGPASCRGTRGHDERHPGYKPDIGQEMLLRRRWTPGRPVHRSHREPPAGGRTRTIAAMPAPRWFFRFMYDRESAAWERRRNEPEHRELVERAAGELANVVAPPGPVADLGCGPGAHALALARRGYDVVGLDGSPRMVEIARTRALRDE